MQRSFVPIAVERHAPAGRPVHAPTILVIGNDDGAILRIHDCAARLGRRVVDARDAITALNMLDADGRIGVAFIDGGSPRFDGLALVERLRRFRPSLACVLFARSPDAEDVVRAMRLHVADMVTDPEDDAQIERAFHHAARALNDAAPILPTRTPTPMAGGHDALERASGHGFALIETVRALRAESAPQRAPVPAAVAEPADSLSILQSIQRKRAARDKFFPKGLFEDPCWDMLLDLMINHLQGRRISVSSLCIASGVAQTTALRRITDLHERGLVHRIADERDGRRVFIDLTEAGVAAMERYAASVGPTG